MIKHQGQIMKMKTEHSSPIQYYLPIGEERILMNDLVGKSIELKYEGKITCLRCGRNTNKSFNQGYCYPCFNSAPENSPCVIKPELCEGHLGGGRDPEWEQKNHVQEHVVYLALSSGLKVGVTRATQVPIRWIDQGASAAIVLARTPNRYTAGLLEVALKEHMADKTNWRKMLTNQIDFSINLSERKMSVRPLIKDDLQSYLTDDLTFLQLEYPVTRYPQKVNSFNFDKTPEISGKLEGIKGQYLIFEGGGVLNIRKFGGYEISLNYD